MIVGCINFSYSRIILIIIFYCIIVISGCKRPDDNIVIKEIKCNAEKLNDAGDRLLSDDGLYMFKGINCRTMEKARSGEYSLKLNKKNRYGFTIVLDNVYEGYNINIRIWKYGNIESGAIISDDLQKDVYYENSKKVIQEDENGWMLIEHDVVIPYNFKDNKLKIYFYNPDTGSIYVDDIHIKIYKEKIYPEYDGPKLGIFVDSAGIAKLKAKRYEALQKGILETRDGDYVRADIIYLSDTLKANIRLKGDWLDHLYGIKWSFRIKVRKKGQWKGMRSFSIQNPSTRGYIHEWLAHKILDEEDVLTTRYGFIPVELNGKSLGLYAYEEHFDKHLVESRNRREGPILKFVEDQFWVTQKIHINTKKYYYLPELKSATILPFKKNRTIRTPALKNDFIIAQNLVDNYRKGDTPLSYIFDLDKLAKLHALIDVTRAHHGLSWHNKRFYYNPVTCNLEQMLFDGYTNHAVECWRNEPIMGNFNIDALDICDIPKMINYRMIEDQDFANRYYKYLVKYANKKYLEQIFEKFNEELKQYEALIQREVPYYKYDSAFLYNVTEEIQNDLPVFRERIKSGYYMKLKDRKCENVNYTKEYNPAFPEYYVKAFRESDNKIKILNFYPFEIEVINTPGNNTNDKIILAAYKLHNTDSKIINTGGSYDSVQFTVIPHNDLFKIPVYPWKSPDNTSHFQSIIEEHDVRDSRLFKIIKDNIYIGSRLYRISKTIFIPEGFKVHMAEGAKLDLCNNSMFISNSPVYINGTAESPVIIKSSDGTCMGFTILQAGEKSVLENVIFDGLNTINYDKWHLTGAVSFYESDVEMSYVEFTNNRCEDALNIIRSEFTMTNCTFDNIFADAFDSDYCTGTLRNCLFRDISNDAIDFSGSKIVIDNCEIENAGDKGISSGEKSELVVSNTRINKANIALASKDLSKVNISNSLISNSNYGFVVFKKKPEYGSAEIRSKNTTLKNILNNHLVEKGSKLYLNDTIISGTEKKVAQRFYVN